MKSISKKMGTKNLVIAALLLITPAYYLYQTIEKAFATPVNTIQYRLVSFNECAYDESDCEFDDIRWGTTGGWVSTNSNPASISTAWWDGNNNTQVRLEWSEDDGLFSYTDYCFEDAWVPADDCGRCTSNATFGRFSHMYNQTSYGDVNNVMDYNTSTGAGRSSCENLEGDDGDKQIDTITWRIRPRGESFTCTTGTNCTPTDFNVDANFSLVFSQPTTGLANYQYRVNTSTSDAVDYATAIGSCGVTDTICATTADASDPVITNIPSGNWHVHFRAIDNAGDGSRHIRLPVTVDNPVLIQSGPPPAQWDSDPSGGTNLVTPPAGIGGTDYLFQINWRSPDEAVHSARPAAQGGLNGASATPALAGVEIDTDNDGVAESVDISANCDGSNFVATVPMTTAETGNKTNYLDADGVRFSTGAVKLCYQSTATKGEWRYRFRFRSNTLRNFNNTANLAGNNTDCWPGNCGTAAGDWQTGLRVNPVELKLEGSGNFANAIVSTGQVFGKWQTNLVGWDPSVRYPGPGADQVNTKFGIKVVYRFSNVSSVSLPAIAIGDIVGAAPGANMGGYNNTACSYVPRVEVDIDTPLRPGPTHPTYVANGEAGTVDFCIALNTRGNPVGDGNEIVLGTGDGSLGGFADNIELPFINCAGANSTNCSSPASNPPYNLPSYINGNQRGLRYRMRIVLNDGTTVTGMPASTEDSMTDVTDNIAGPNTGTALAGNSLDHVDYSPNLAFTADPVNADFPDEREILIVKNPILVFWSTEAEYNGDADDNGKGVSPNCGYGGFVTGDPDDANSNIGRHDQDPLRNTANSLLSANCQGAPGTDKATTLSPAWKLKIQVWDPDGLEFSRICKNASTDTGACDDWLQGTDSGDGIIGTDGGNPFVMAGLDFSDDGNISGSATDAGAGITEWDPVTNCTIPTTYACGGNSFCDRANNGMICEREIPAGTIRYIAENNPGFNGLLVYRFKMRTKYYSASSDVDINTVRWDPNATGSTHNPLTLPASTENLYLRVDNNQPFLTWAPNDGSLTACHGSPNFNNVSGVSPQTNSPTSNFSSTPCYEGGSDFRFRIQYHDYDGYLPGQGLWRPDVGFVHGANLNRAQVWVDLDNDGNYNTVNAYPYSDVCFDDNGEKFTMTPVAGSILDRLSTTCGGDVANDLCISESYELAPRDFGTGSCGANEPIKLYANDSTLGGIGNCTGTATCTFADHSFRFVLGDDSFDPSSAIDCAGNRIAEGVGNNGTYESGSCTPTGDDQGAEQSIGVVNHAPKIEVCGLNFTDWKSSSGHAFGGWWYDTPTNTLYPASGAYNQEDGAFDDDYTHFLDIGSSVAANPDADDVYHTDTKDTAPRPGVDKSYNNDVVRFCLRYTDEDRWPPYNSGTPCGAMNPDGNANDTGPCMALDQKGGGTSWNNVTMTPLAQLVGSSDSDAGAIINYAPGDNTSALRRGIVYMYQTVAIFPISGPTAGGSDTRSAQFEFNAYYNGALPTNQNPFFTDASELASGISSIYNVVRVAPVITPMYTYKGLNYGAGAPPGDVHYVYTQAANNTDASDSNYFTVNPSVNNDIWPLESMYRIETANIDDISAGADTNWNTPAEQNRAIDYYSQWVRGTPILNNSAATNTRPNQRYLGGAFSNCVSGPGANEIHHVRSISRTLNAGTATAQRPRNQEDTSCGDQGVSIQSVDFGAGTWGTSNLFEVFTPRVHANNTGSEVPWESFASFSFAWPHANKGNVMDKVTSGLTGSNLVYLYGYTGTVYKFALLWWRPKNFVQPTDAGVGVDYNRNGRYDNDEMSYYLYNNVRQNPFASTNIVNYGSEPDANQSTYYKCNGQMPLTGIGHGLTNCKPYVFFSNVKLETSSAVDGQLLAYHYAFKMTDFKYPVFRHGATADDTSEIYMGPVDAQNPQLSKINTPLMSGSNQVRPFDPYILVKYRSPPTLEPFEVEKNGENKYRFKVRYINPYKVGPSCSAVSPPPACVAGAAAVQGHSHVIIDLNGNGDCSDDERQVMSPILPDAAAKATFDSDGYADFEYPDSDTQPDGIEIPYGSVNELKYCFDFAEYRYDGTGDDRGLVANNPEIDFKLKEYKEPVVLNCNYQRPDSKEAGCGNPKFLLNTDQKGKASIRIYSVSGRLVYDGNGQWVDLDLQSQANPLVWNMQSNKGVEVGSGVYLAVIVREIDGKLEKPIKKKIVIVR